MSAPVCGQCGSTDGVKMRSSRTAYDTSKCKRGPNGELLDDPNAPVVLCDGCGKDHDASWDERWEEYYRG